jgi:hypothetical protein
MELSGPGPNRFTLGRRGELVERNHSRLVRSSKQRLLRGPLPNCGALGCEVCFIAFDRLICKRGCRNRVTFTHVTRRRSTQASPASPAAMLFISIPGLARLTRHNLFKSLYLAS